MPMGTPKAPAGENTIPSFRQHVYFQQLKVVAEFESAEKSGCGKVGSKRLGAQKQKRHNNFIDSLVSKLYSPFMARFPDIVDGLRKQRKSDADDIRETGEELSELRSAYQRYRDLSEHLDSRIERVKIVLALLASEESEQVGEAFEFLDGLGIILEAPADLQEEMPLWKMVREVVRQSEELRIVELENVMRSLKVKTSRQAIEAAIDAHKRTFKIRRSGREKFVSLKH